MPKYNHVLAIHPFSGDSARAFKGLFPPIGLEYIAASMKDVVGKVTLLDLRYEKRFQDKKVLNDFIRREIDLICVGIMWESGFKDVIEFITKLPPEIPTVVGGRTATEEVETIFERCPNVDMVVRGEGEEIIRQIAEGVPEKDILGLSYRNNGSIVHNQNQVLPDVTKLPYPDRSLRRHDYWAVKNGIRLSGHTFDAVLTTRGCPFKCKFCTFNLNPLGQKRNYTERTIESVIDELKNVRGDVVLFSDDNFFTNPKRSEELCDEIIRNKINKKFVCQTRIDVAKYPRLLGKAEKAGFKMFLIGVESPHDKILKQFNKGITQQQIRDAFKVLSRYKIHLHSYFIYGNVGETEEEMVYIAQFAREIKTDTITFQKLRIEKFSPLKELVESNPNYYYSKVGGSVYSKTHGRKELKQVRDKIRNRFYTWSHMLHLVRKSLRIGMINGRDLMNLVLRLPTVLYAMASRDHRKAWRRRALGK